MPSAVANVYYQGRKVGRTAMADNRRAAFEYDSAWIADGFSISPFYLPLEKRVFIADLEPFNGNFGVFDDSLPEGWGRLLIDRLLKKQGVDLASISIVDRLLIVGSNGMGALEYKPENRLVKKSANETLAELAKETKKILAEKDSNKLETLVKMGGSSGGARPKVLIDFEKEAWIVKFRSSFDPRNVGKIEFNYSQAARLAGLDMPETKLFEGKFFGVKRFDRRGAKKIHKLSASALLNASYRLPSLDYVDLINAALTLTRDFAQAQKLYRQACFNVFAHNRDDHAKNFAFLYDDNKWSVSPAFDLTYSEGINGEHATTIDGEGKNPTKERLLSVANKVGLNMSWAKITIEETKKVVEKARLFSADRNS
jgi:serine/threonine-protein kinase HipA